MNKEQCIFMCLTNQHKWDPIFALGLVYHKWEPSQHPNHSHGTQPFERAAQSDGVSSWWTVATQDSAFSVAWPAPLSGGCNPKLLSSTLVEQLSAVWRITHLPQEAVVGFLKLDFWQNSKQALSWFCCEKQSIDKGKLHDQNKKECDLP